MKDWIAVKAAHFLDRHPRVGWWLSFGSRTQRIAPTTVIGTLREYYAVWGPPRIEEWVKLKVASVRWRFVEIVDRAEPWRCWADLGHWAIGPCLHEWPSGGRKGAQECGWCGKCQIIEEAG